MLPVSETRCAFVAVALTGSLLHALYSSAVGAACTVVTWAHSGVFVLANTLIPAADLRLRPRLPDR
jgi:hypothetical protein